MTRSAESVYNWLEGIQPSPPNAGAFETNDRDRNDAPREERRQRSRSTVQPPPASGRRPSPSRAVYPDLPSLARSNDTVLVSGNFSVNTATDSIRTESQARDRRHSNSSGISETTSVQDFLAKYYAAVLTAHERPLDRNAAATLEVSENMSVSSRNTGLSNLNTSMVESIIRNERTPTVGSATFHGLSLELPAAQRVGRQKLPRYSDASMTSTSDDLATKPVADDMTEVLSTHEPKFPGHYSDSDDEGEALSSRQNIASQKGTHTSDRNAPMEASQEGSGTQPVAYPMLDLPEGYMPTIQYYDEDGKKVVKQLKPELLYARRQRGVLSDNEHNTLWEGADDILQTFTVTTANKYMPILHTCHPNIPTLDSPPALLRSNASVYTVAALEDDLQRLKSLYGEDLNPLQKEEMAIAEKLSYVADHYREAIMGKDLISKSALTSMGKDVLFALSALNADDYGIRDAAAKPFEELGRPSGSN